MNNELALEAQKVIKKFENAIQATNNYGTIEEHIYSLLGGDEFGTRPHCYRNAVISFLVAVADPDISKNLQDKMGAYGYKMFIELVQNLESFCTAMQSDNYQAWLQAAEISLYPYEEKKYQDIIKKYTHLHTVITLPQS